MASHKRHNAWLRIESLRCIGAHGAYEGEKEHERLFLLNVALETDIENAARNDSLDQTPDFAAIARLVRGVVGGEPRTLLERVALDVARSLLAAFPACTAARVRVRKPDPPGLDAEEESVEVWLEQGEP